MDQLFEYNREKSITNKIKYKIDFEQAKIVWDDTFALVAATKHVEDEERWMIVGKIAEKIWSVIFTYRQNKIRIISARRARKEEVEQYEKNKR